MKKHYLLLSLFAIFALLTISCSKKGDPGADGAPGNALNISGTFAPTSAEYVLGTYAYQTGPGSSSALSARVATLAIPKLTQKIFEEGTVMVYMKTPASLGGPVVQYTALPFTIPAFNTGYLIKYTFAYETGKLRIYYMHEATDQATAGSIPPVSNATVPTNTFKYVILPGAAGFGSAGAQINIANYNEMKSFYKLPD